MVRVSKKTRKQVQESRNKVENQVDPEKKKGHDREGSDKEDTVIEKIKESTEPNLHWVILVLGFVSIIIGAGLYDREVPFLSIVTLSTILKEAGIALVIAAIAVVVIERRRIETYQNEISRLTESKIEKISTASIKKAISGILPDSFFEVLTEVALNAKFIRRDQKLSLLLEWHDEENELLKLYTKCTYKVKNISNEVSLYTVGAAEGLTFEDLSPGHTCIRYVEAYDEEESAVVKKKDCGERDKDDLYIGFYEDVTVYPDQDLSVRIQSERIIRSQGDDVIMFMCATEGMEIEVASPEEIDVAIEPGHPNFKGALKPLNNTMRSDKLVRDYFLNDPILPYWVLVFRWRPLKYTSNGTATDEEGKSD